MRPAFFRFCYLEESHVDHRVLMYQGGTDNLLSLIAVILAISYRVEFLFRALENLLQEGIGLLSSVSFPITGFSVRASMT